MPYGMKNETPAMTSWMERCVDSVHENSPDLSKGGCIAICKVQYQKTKKKKASSETSLEFKVHELREKILEQLHPRIESPSMVEGSWLEDMDDDSIVVRIGEDLFKVNYSWKEDSEDLSIEWESAVKVDRVTSYEPCENEEASNKKVTYGGLIRKNK